MREMLRSCACFRRPRRGSSFEDSSSCRSSEIERGGELQQQHGHSDANSLIRLFTSKGWCRQWRKPGRGMSMTRIERSEYYLQKINTFFIYYIDLKNKLIHSKIFFFIWISFLEINLFVIKKYFIRMCLKYFF